MIFMNKIKPIGFFVDVSSQVNYLSEIRKILMFENFKILFSKNANHIIPFLIDKGVKYLIFFSSKDLIKEEILSYNLPYYILNTNLSASQFAYEIEKNINFLDLNTNDKGIGYTDIYYEKDFEELLKSKEMQELNIAISKQLDI